MRYRPFLVLTIVIALTSGCQKINLQRDGYFILKVNDKRISYDKCLFTLGETSRPNTIVASDFKNISDSVYPNDFDIHIYFYGEVVSTNNEYDSLFPDKLNVSIKFNDQIYRFPHNNLNSFKQESEVNLVIDEYDSKKKKCKGSISGKFYNNSGDFIEVKTSKFVAMNYYN